jgi:hypothetical protein
VHRPKCKGGRTRRQAFLGADIKNWGRNLAYAKRIVCLANSVKIGGRCIAGREIKENGALGPWIRPISVRPSAELTLSECGLQDRSTPKLLDILEVQFLQAAPHFHQSENHYIDADVPWKKVGELPRTQIDLLCEEPESLWINSDSTTTGTLNCISVDEAHSLTASLTLIKLDKFSIEVGTNAWSGKRMYRGNFHYKGAFYSFSLTDPVLLSEFGSKKEGEYNLGAVCLCLSLTEPAPTDNRCHKLVAGVIKN